MYFAFDIAREEVVWYRKVERVGGTGDVCKTRNEFAWKHCPDNFHRNVYFVCSCFQYHRA